MEQQPSCFLDFGKLSRRIEVGESRREQVGCCPGATIRAVEARKSKYAAQFERLRLLASCDVQRSIERIFSRGHV